MRMPDAASWQRLSPLLDELLSLAPLDRQARLRAAADDELAPQLQALLSAAGAADDANFMRVGSGDPQESDSTIAGRRIGAYAIEALIGAGASGKVWRARRVDGSRGAVAIKLLHRSLVGQAAAVRFRREAVILARVAHPHIARLLDSGVTAEGQPYLVLELVEGSPIDRYCDAQGLDIAARVRLFLQVLEAVAHAHGRGVLHLDIKPGNVHVGRDGRAKLLDFGIARMLVQGAEGAVTPAGRRLLTPLYAAPEQVQGLPLGKTADIHALGVLLYQLLSAAPDRQPIGLALTRIVKRAVRENPANRYPDAESFARDLDRFLDPPTSMFRQDTLSSFLSAFRFHP